MSKSGLKEALIRGFVLVFLGAMMFVGTVIFFNGVDQNTVQVIRMSSLFPFAIAVVDVLTVMSRRDTRNPILVFISTSIRTARSVGRSVQNSFGRDEDFSITEQLVDECDRCGRQEHRGIHAQYENPYRLFRIPVKDVGKKERDYCNVCVNEATFEIAPDERWGRTNAVAEELNHYYHRNR